MRDYAGLYAVLLADLGLASKPDAHVFSDMDDRAVAKTSLATSFYKKLCPTGNSVQADTAALDKFKAINIGLPEEPFEFNASNEAESCFWDYFCNHLNTAIGDHESIESYNLDSIRERMMVGPGAAQKADSTSIVTKLFDGLMTTTDDYITSIYRAALVDTGFWADAEMRRFSKFGITKVRGGKLFFAPKNAEISRTCCTEANLNMLIQKSIGSFLEFRLGWYFGISLSTQPDYNRKLACIGSIDGSFGTIDLTSASDSIGLRLMQRVLQHSFLKTMIMKSRSESAVLPDGSEVVLRMISTMGNGFTFPLQTVIFASAVRAVYQLMGFPSDCAKTQFAVFGDDIIVRHEAYNFLIRMLNKLGFSVNVGKSFNTGPFRESCGHDYCRGLNVRGVYIRSLETPQHVYSAFNRLTRWSAFHGIELPNVMKILFSWIRDIRVPLSESDDAGIHVPFKCTIPKVDARYWFSYRAYRRRVQRVVVPEPDSETVPVFNPDGIAVGFLAGHIRRRDFSYTTDQDNPWNSKDSWGLSVSLRDKIGARARYQIVTKTIPFWDYIPISKKVYGSVGDEWRVDLTVDSHRAWECTVVAILDSCQG